MGGEGRRAEDSPPYLEERSPLQTELLLAGGGLAKRVGVVRGVRRGGLRRRRAEVGLNRVFTPRSTERSHEHPVPL